jgi:hypothetical protein
MSDRTIWKYGLNPANNRLDVPGMSRPLFVGFQGEQLYLWCVARPGAPLVTYRFFVAITGGEFPDDAGPYVGSAQSPRGIVTHVFMMV